MSSPHRGRDRMGDPLELELEMVGAAVWVLGAKLGSSERAVKVLNH